jgi:hypothetical protein
LSLSLAINRPSVAFLPTLAALLALAGGCTKPNPDYCERAGQCPAGRVCQIATHTCVMPDAGIDVGVDAPADLGADLARDTASAPDTTPDLRAPDGPNSCGKHEDCPTADKPSCINGQCAACIGNNHCPKGGFCAAGRCVVCTATDGCEDTPAAPVCVQSRCASCTMGTDACKIRYTDKPVCHPNGTCVGCLDSLRDCPLPGRPICVANGCVACPDDAACVARNAAAGACDKSNGFCVECTEDKHCTATGKPICDVAMKKCVPCTADAQCGKKLGAGLPAICMAHQDGRCASEAEIIHVSNGPGCSAGGGTAAAPFCQTSDAINAVTPARRVLLLRGPEALTPFTASPTGAPITVVGQMNATIAPGAFVGIRVSAGEVYLRGVTVSGSTQTGVIVENGATLRMERCLLTGNRGGLLALSAGFDVANTVIASNKGALVPNTATSFGGVYLRPAPGKPSVFRHNTIVDNEVIGLLCAEALPVKSLLVANNAVEQVLTCVPASSMVGGDPKFDPARPYHLTPASPCVAAGDMTDFPGTDLDGDPRPLPAGTRTDCGADELSQ